MKIKIAKGFKHIKKAPKGAKNLIKKAHTKFRCKFPKKPPKYFDGGLHQHRYLLLMGLSSFLIYLYIEEFARITSGVFDGIKFLFTHPIIFFYNAGIIFATMTIALLFKKRSFAFFMIGLFWVIIGSGNGAILIKRMTPFTVYDLHNLGDGVTLITTYFSKIQIMIAVIFLGLLISIIVFSFLSSTKWKNISYKKSIITIFLSFGLVAGATMGLLKMNALSTFFGNLNYAYRDYGFPYCIINTSLNTGIAKPADYSKERVEKLLKEQTEKGLDRKLKKENTDKAHPNIIILQLESFTTADSYNHISVDRDPTPVFNNLKKKFSTGKFTVPACGAGTANTEFEVLTGISAKFFGPGEYPYKGILRRKTLESMAYVTKSKGYNTEAFHNHRAVFYNRNEVYANLGFNSFTSIEYMNDIKKTPTGWAKDMILTDNIIDAMKKSDSRDFMHVISVEGHGSYPKEQIFKNPYTTVHAEKKDTKWKYEYYLNECHEMDTFIGDLLEKLEKLGEPTIMIIYGDHIPALDVKEKEYKDGDLYSTEYVIWDNIGLKKKDKDLHSYESGSELLKDAGLVFEGTIFDYQQNNDSRSKNYLKDQEMLAYDMLYGNKFTFGQKNLLKPSKMKMGYKEITIDKIVKIGDRYYITGKNFTEHSSVSLKGKVLKTVYLSPTLIGLEQKVDPEDVAKLKVSQIDTKDDTILTTIGGLEEL